MILGELGVVVGLVYFELISITLMCGLGLDFWADLSGILVAFDEDSGARSELT